ncbi:hypothetical protein PGT21_026067 [Puccinia graminis f. sp. tritici]|uniref:Uncharacterized protein n=1 Tax=Puccinia graminis f. sp. tritici TaxID=56615 RepID=A0A5B0NB93_PUCGR|nr:hypothetical protein PGT21_026067 [Puccinia graminis f. sp. tritici]KAA1113820.1 hypothetical protein PGTUg99_024114 [Puccinia graminis f. sp. tritici]
MEEQQQEQPEEVPQAKAKEEEDEEGPSIKEEGDQNSDGLTDHFQSPEEYSRGNEKNAAQDPAPVIDGPVGCIICDRTLQVKPVKYLQLLKDSCFTNDPKTF